MITQTNDIWWKILAIFDFKVGLPFDWYQSLGKSKIQSFWLKLISKIKENQNF